ncbi:MAG TPA: SRPBCC family protein [Azospirillaceae bacterium]|nr:SRPBCC family protein [Azospirillaceae bacterium]
MSIAPIVRAVEVKAGPARAFDLFTANMGLWWPRSFSIAPAPQASVHLEPREGGRWFERDEAGGETDWGRVLVWDPPSRLVLAWQITARWSFDPDLVTEVELAFEPAGEGRTRVTLEHRNLERFGADAEAVAGHLGGGWQKPLDLFAQLVETHP